MGETKEKSFQESLRVLEQAAEQIGQPATSLEESLKLFDQGIRESKYLNEILEEAEQKIEIYVVKEEDHA